MIAMPHLLFLTVVFAAGLIAWILDLNRWDTPTDGPFRLCECGIGIAVDPRDELKVYRRHRLHLEAVEHVSRDRHPAFGSRDV